MSVFDMLKTLFSLVTTNSSQVQYQYNKLEQQALLYLHAKTFGKIRIHHNRVRIDSAYAIQRLDIFS